MSRGLCLAMLVLCAGVAEAGSAEGWRGKDGWRGGESRVWRAPEGWRGGESRGWRGTESWRRDDSRIWRGSWGARPWTGFRSRSWPYRPWGSAPVDRVEPVWIQGDQADIRPRTICVKPVPGYDYTGWGAPPPHRFLSADYRCIETQ